jgi:hypothetical protein
MKPTNATISINVIALWISAYLPASLLGGKCEVNLSD